MDVMEFMFGLIIFGMFALIGIAMYDSVNYDVEKSSTDILLHNLNDGSEIHGSFSLGSGYIDQEPCFVFYMMEDNGYILKTVPANKSKIIEDENDKPYIRVIHEIDRGEISNMIVGSDTRYEFHVPQGTIIEKWSLDAQL